MIAIVGMIAPVLCVSEDVGVPMLHNRTPRRVLPREPCLAQIQVLTTHGIMYLKVYIYITQFFVLPEISR